jgi:sulfoxide reductase heme-binding subunit YedZ
VLVWRALTGRLGADPVEEVLHAMGYWALVMLLATLAVSPVRKLSGWNPIIGVRRLLGLFAFFYATLHVAVYFGVDQFFEISAIIEDIIKRPFITVGFLAWVLLIPLAATSTPGWIRRLGKRWQLLHRLVYLTAVLGVVHFLWSTKVDEPEPVIFAVGLLVLLAFRAPRLRRRHPARE